MRESRCRRPGLPHAAAKVPFAVASDHAGVELKSIVVAALNELGHLVTDLGTHDTSPVDYPDYALIL